VFTDERHAAMLRVIEERYRFADRPVLDAMARVRRDRFVPDPEDGDPFGDHPRPIGYEQTISQPYIVAYMTSLLQVRAGDKVLEVGTGSGYQAAVLCALGAEVDTVERIPELAARAAHVLESEGFGSVRVHTGDGAEGWPAGAPYDAIVVTCAPAEVPPTLFRQLADGGRLVAPVGSVSQRLARFMKQGEEVTREDDIFVRFVPMVSTRLGVA
jgi:protein-L-isoaspartate(D-aspartate) O-methyltransferase